MNSEPQYDLKSNYNSQDMKKIFTFILLAGMLSACHITSDEPEVQDKEKSYEAYGLLTIPSSGFTKEDVRTKIVLVDEEQLDIYMFDVKFSSMMPVTIDMVISGVGYLKTADEIQFYGDSIIPTAGNKPYEKYIVTNLQGFISSDSLCLSNNYGDTPSAYAGKLTKE